MARPPLTAIPRSLVAPLGKVLSLDEAERQRLLGVLGGVGVSSDLNQAAQAVVEGTGFDDDEAVSVVRLLASLYEVRAATDLDVSELARSVVELSNAKRLREGTVADDATDSEFVASLLGFRDGFAITAKLWSVKSEVERVYCTARVLTDIRPAFADDPTQSPGAAVVAHTLRLAYHEGPEMRKVMIALNGDDIDELIAVLGRAKAKAEALRDGTAAVSMRIL